MPWPFALYLFILFALTISGAVVAALMSSSIENTASWDQSSCDILTRNIQGRCSHSGWGGCGSDAERYRVSFLVTNYTHTRVSPNPIFDEVQAFYGVGGDYYMTEKEARVIMEREALTPGQRAPCFIHPKDSSVISMGYGLQSSTSNLGFIFSVTISVCLGVVFLISLVGYGHQRKRNIEESQRVQLTHVDHSQRKHKYRHRRREILEVMKNECVVPPELVAAVCTDQDCSICLDPLTEKVEMPESVLREGAEVLDMEISSDAIWKVSCGHYFHAHCFADWVWVGKGRVCPLCHYRLRNMLKPAGEATKTVPDMSEPQNHHEFTETDDEHGHTFRDIDDAVDSPV
mmetsp:Transcript_12425/g.12512  ORF Transcript_12425/g.12512 Transcript_12425/m.12512 type:complete len:345 (+) Transcript_12425:3-1037(+)